MFTGLACISRTCARCCTYVNRNIRNKEIQKQKISPQKSSPNWKGPVTSINFVSKAVAAVAVAFAATKEQQSPLATESSIGSRGLAHASPSTI
ncbi:hypothetical protein V1477_010733 [Vespula maculifrons]|uniref:Uncharacterized protein n=1 Tax=Vespula maculifrons TaxID=7453 RepID=A0ABD2C2S5_VESMC